MSGQKYEIQQDANHGSQTEFPVINDKLEQARSEWDSVTTVVIGQNTADREQQDENIVTVSPLLTVDDAVNHFARHNNLSAHKKGIKPTITYGCFQFCLLKLFGPPSLNSALVDSRDMLFAMAAWLLDNDDSVHIRMLNSVYRNLTGAKRDPARYGDHWDDIGFQGKDPATDLRGGGCLGLINLLYITSTPRYKYLVKDIFNLSRHVTQNFPFCVMSLNMTRIALQALRRQLLNKEANKKGDIMSIFNDFYVGCYLYIFTKWKAGKTISDSGHLLKETETHCCKNVPSVLKLLTVYTDTAAAPTEEPVNRFTDIETLIH